MISTQKIHGTGEFVTESVRIVDYNSENSNLLVRGSAAFGASNFRISDLVSAIKKDTYYQNTGITLAPNPMVIDFCLIGFGPSNTKDRNIVGAEVQWFDPSRSNPPSGDSQGKYPICIPSTSGSNVMVYWPVLAIGGQPPTTSGGSWGNAAAVELSIGQKGYHFSGLIPAISSALNNNPSQISGFPKNTPIQNAVVYIHCDSGVNRTGAAVIAYLMQYGSNILHFNVSPRPQEPYHTLLDAQNAALANPPSNNTPPGGVDQGVSEAYCNLINTGTTTKPLSANCVPKLGSVSN